MPILAALLALETILHALVVVRFGLDGGNAAFAFFTLVFAALTIAVWFRMAYAVPIVLAVTLFGIVASSVTFGSRPDPRTLFIAILLNDAAVLAVAGYLAWKRRRGAT